MIKGINIWTDIFSLTQEYLPSSCFICLLNCVFPYTLVAIMKRAEPTFSMMAGVQN